MMKNSLPVPTLSELQEIVATRFPASACDVIGVLARKTCSTKSNVVRSLVLQGLVTRGLLSSEIEIAL